MSGADLRAGGGAEQTGPCRPRPRRADPRRGGREPEPVGRERRAAVDRPGVRLVAGHAQPDRGRLLARARGLGALPRRARRPLRAQDDARPRHRARDPDVAAGRVRAVGRGAVRGARRRRARRRDGLPDHTGADHGALVGPGPHEVDRALVGARRRDRRARPARRRCAARGVLVGIGLPRHAAARRRRAGHGVPLRAEPRERDERSGRQPRRNPLGRPRRRPHPRDQLRAGPERRSARARAGRDRAGRARRVLHPPEASREPAVRPPDRGSPHLLGRGVCGNHRLRLADGRHVRQPAVPAERARLLDTRGRSGDPARGARDGRGRAAVREAHRGSRFSLHPALRLRVPVPGVPLDAAGLGRRLAVLAHRGRVHLRGRGRRDSRVRRRRTR